MAAAEMPMVGAPSAGGDLGSAPAPGPGMGMPPADVLFTLTAAGANLSAEKLVLTGVADTALFSSSSRQTGVYTTGRHPGPLLLDVPPCLYSCHLASCLYSCQWDIFAHEAKFVVHMVCTYSWSAFPTMVLAWAGKPS